MVGDRHDTADRDDREDQKGRHQSQVGSQLEHEAVRLIRQQGFFEKELDPVRESLHDPEGTRPVRPDAVLHVRDDLALEPDRQHDADEKHREDDDHLDDDDDERPYIDAVGE